MSKRLSTVLLEEAHQASLELDAAELRVLEGPDRGHRVQLGPDSLCIGSRADCDLVLHDDAVSGRHAEIVVQDDGYLIRDLGSKNGLQLGTWRVQSASLADRMKVRLGTTVIAVRWLGTQQSVPLALTRGRFGVLVAHSVKMRALAAALAQLAPADIAVLIEGETGTGKEAAALSLHRASGRQDGPFVVFDCGAVRPSLVASELFGHERGAFTGADALRVGLFEEADGGTLFLDEIGELPLEIQPVLLRAIESRAIRRIGGNKEIPFDVRIVAATNRNLAEEVRARRFRQDLYFRLAVARVRMPRLRDRAEDIPILAQEFAAELSTTLTPEVQALLRSYDWPGNVRELRNAIARFAARGHGDGSLPVDLGISAEPLLPLQGARRAAADEFERAYLDRALQLAGGSVTQAADLAGVTRQFFTKLLARHNLRVRDRSSASPPDEAKS